MTPILRPGPLDWAVAAAMALLLPLAPFVASLIARDWRYAARYPSTLLRAAGHLRGQVRSAAASRYRAHARGHLPTPERIAGACTHCGKCCLDRRCVFLEWSPRGESRCRIYGTAFWKRLACGRYPENRMDIALYACPGFRAESGDEAGDNLTRTCGSSGVHPGGNVAAFRRGGTMGHRGSRLVRGSLAGARLRALDPSFGPDRTSRSSETQKGYCHEDHPDRHLPCQRRRPGRLPSAGGDPAFGSSSAPGPRCHAEKPMLGIARTRGPRGSVDSAALPPAVIPAKCVPARAALGSVVANCTTPRM